MAKTSIPVAESVNSGAETDPESPAINAAPVATPENTPVPGAGRWSWNAAARRWEDASDSQTATAAPIPTLE